MRDWPIGLRPTACGASAAWRGVFANPCPHIFDAERRGQVGVVRHSKPLGHGFAVEAEKEGLMPVRVLHGMHEHPNPSTIHLLVSSAAPSNSSHIGSNLIQPPRFCWSERGRPSLKLRRTGGPVRLAPGGLCPRGPFPSPSLLCLGILCLATTRPNHPLPRQDSHLQACPRLKAAHWNLVFCRPAAY